MYNNLDTRSITFNIIVINVLFFVVCTVIPPLNSYLSLHYFFNKHDYLHIISIGDADIASHFPNLSYMVSLTSDHTAKFLPLQIITHMFMHGGLSHIFFNMFGLVMLGVLLERVWGPQRYLLFYFTTGFGAVILYMLFQAYLVHQATGSVNPSMAVLEAHPEIFGTYFSSAVGASGALFGILTASAMLFPNTELNIMFLPVRIRTKYFVAGYVLIELYMGFARYRGDDVAHFAHLGGALFGYLLVKYWNKNRTWLY